jgi:hypothetical protein
MNYENEIYKIIMKHSVKLEEFEERKIYYVDKEGFKKIWDIKEEYIKSLVEAGEKEEFVRTYALRNWIVKIINPVFSGIKVIGYGYINAYSLVIDKEKILEKYLETEFERWKKKQYIQMKKEIKKANDVTEQEKVKNFFEETIRQAEELKDSILQHPDKYEIVYTEYPYKDKNKIVKPVIHFYYKDKKGNIKKTHAYLRENVPNIVYEENLMLSDKPKIKKIEKTLSQMRNVFGKIFIKEKKNVK